MFVKKIELKDYRNYDLLSLDFGQGINIFHGNNAQGKTNLLEAIYLCATSKSHKLDKDKEIIQFGKGEAHIKMIVEKKDVPYRIDMHLRKSKSKGIAINQIPIKRSSELFGIVNVVFFSPEDLEIVKGGPAVRRRFIDLELCQLDKVYLNQLVSYNKVLQNRNKLLKELDYFHPDFSLLDVYDEQLAGYGEEVVRRRKEFIDQLNEMIFEIHRELTGGKEKLKLVYDVSGGEESSLYDRLLAGRMRDLKIKTTGVGPHRDDLAFFHEKLDLRKFGSQGQQRTVALSLKLSEISLIKKITGDTPVLLLDDVLSELDSSRQKQLLKSIDEIQTFITCTGYEELIQSHFKNHRVYQIEKGKVKEGLGG